MKPLVPKIWHLAVLLICLPLFNSKADTPSPPAENPDIWNYPIVAQLTARDIGDTTRPPQNPFSHQAESADSTAPKDTTKIIVKRDFVHKEQMAIGSTIMIFFIFLIVSMANWNPK